MILQLEDSVEVEVIRGQILPLIPKWFLKPDNVVVSSHRNMEEHEQQHLKTIGSGNWHAPLGNEFRFTEDNLLLTSVWVKATEENLESSSVMEKWTNIEPVSGILRLLSHQSFRCELNEYRWISPNGKFLAAIEDTDIIESDDKFRLRVAQDFDLLFAEQKWCGWLLSNPARYLAEPNSLADLDTELPLLAYEYISLISEPNIDLLYDKEPEFLQRIIDLRAKIDLNSGATEHRREIHTALEEIIESFYGTAALNK